MTTSETRCRLGTLHWSASSVIGCDIGSMSEACPARLWVIATEHPDPATAVEARKQIERDHPKYRKTERPIKWRYGSDNDK